MYRLCVLVRTLCCFSRCYTFNVLLLPQNEDKVENGEFYDFTKPPCLAVMKVCVACVYQPFFGGCNRLSSCLRISPLHGNMSGPMESKREPFPVVGSRYQNWTCDGNRPHKDHFIKAVQTYLQLFLTNMYTCTHTQCFQCFLYTLPVHNLTVNITGHAP